MSQLVRDGRAAGGCVTHRVRAAAPTIAVVTPYALVRAREWPHGAGSWSSLRVATTLPSRPAVPVRRRCRLLCCSGMEFRLLGPVEAYRQGRPVDLGRRRERCLLCLLLLETGRTVPVERLLDLLWDGSPPETGRGQLRVNVSRLRSRLDAARTGVRITARGGGY